MNFEKFVTRKNSEIVCESHELEKKLATAHEKCPYRANYAGFQTGTNDLV